jgi:endonuclease G, mitochondrial
MIKDKIFRIAVYLFLAAISANESAYAQFNYLPAPQSDCELKTYLEFSLCYDEAHEQPRWVAYELTAEELAMPMTRKDYFKEDKSISTGSAVANDYRNSGYDRGHIARAMYCKSSLDAYKESFLFSNISPQIPNFNRSGGDWFRLEELEVKLAEQLGKIYVVSGPVFRDNLGSIGENNVTIPGYFYKAILSPDYNYSIAFLVRHENTKADVWNYAITIDSLEAFTNLDFFPALDDSIEDLIEAKLDLNWWQSPQILEIFEPFVTDEEEPKEKKPEEYEPTVINSQQLLFASALLFAFVVAIFIFRKG